MNQKGYGKKTLIIKPTTSCNFNCNFCSAKLLNIPIHKYVPDKLKKFLISYKPSDIIITGGEPLINPKTYFCDLIKTLDKTKIDFNLSLTSNLMLWYKNPKSFDYLFSNEHVSVCTSFQYGNDRKGESVYTEEQFVNLFTKFYERYNERLMFIYVVNENNEQYVLKACKLAKILKTTFKLNQQMPIGLSNYFYPRYKLLKLYIDIVKAGYKDQLESLNSLYDGKCPYPRSYKFCLYNKIVYINQNGELIENCCEDIASSKDKIEITNETLFNKCLTCKMFNLCNSCSTNVFFSKKYKEEQCKWMKENYNELSEYGFI